MAEAPIDFGVLFESTVLPDTLIDQGCLFTWQCRPSKSIVSTSKESGTSMPAARSHSPSC